MKKSTALYIVLSIVAVVVFLGLGLYLSYGEEYFMTEILGYTKKGPIPITDIIFEFTEIKF